MDSISNRRIIVTGAASGIGQATARMLAEKGAKLFLLDRDDAGLRRQASELGCSSQCIDLRDQQMIGEVVQTAASDLGGLDCVVNVAGITRKIEVGDVSASDWADLLGINLLAPFWLIQASLPHLRKGTEPAIVNVSSGTALRPTIPGYSTYAASKGGLITMTKALAFELAPQIRVNAVCPGATVSAMLSEEGAAMASGPNSPYALKRSAQPEEIAKAICFLAGSDSSYMTGATVAVDGGRTLY